MRLVGRLLATVGLGLVFSGPAAAQGFQCEHAPAIVSLSNSILTKRQELTGFQRRNAPAPTAAYLLIWYAPLNDGDTESLLSDLIEDGARGIDEVAFSWSYAQYDGAVTERMLGPDALTKLLEADSRTSIRALTREGHDEELLDAIAALPETSIPSISMSVAVAMLDNSDARKADLAQKALDRGLPLLAATLSATQEKGLKAWEAFVKQLNDPALLEDFNAFLRWMPGMMGLPELPRVPVPLPAADQAMRDKVHEIMIASSASPQLQFIWTLLNQTGNTEETYPAAVALLAAIERGDIAREGPFGPAWLLTYRQLLADWDDGELQSQLRSFQLPGPGSGETPMAIIDALLATEALTPYLRGETSTPPTAPGELSEDGLAAWPQWLDVAGRVKADPADPTLVAADATLLMATELLLWTGNSGAVARLIEAAPATSGVNNLAAFAAIHLDRLCESYLYHPAEAIQQWPIYKFDG